MQQRAHDAHHVRLDVRLVLAAHAHDHRALFRRIAEQRLRRIFAVEVVENRERLEHHVVAVLEHRHAAARIHRQHVRRLVLLHGELQQVAAVRQAPCARARAARATNKDCRYPNKRRWPCVIRIVKCGMHHFTTLIDASTLVRTTRSRRSRAVRLPLRPRQRALGRDANTPARIFRARSTCISIGICRAPSRAASGRHPLPDPRRFRARARRARRRRRTHRSSPTTRATARYAARLWWLARWIGLRDVAVLDGGIAAWRAAGLPLETAVRTPVPRTLSAVRWIRTPGSAANASTSCGCVRGPRSSTRAAPNDSRAATRRIDPVAGHVPGARNHPFLGNLGADGKFLPAAELRAALADAARLAAAIRGDRHVRLGSHRLPQPARARTCRTPGCASVCRLLERVDPRLRDGRSPPARSRARVSFPTFTCKTYLVSCAPTWQPNPTPFRRSRRVPRRRERLHRLVRRRLRRALPGQRLGQGLFLRESGRPSRGASRHESPRARSTCSMSCRD